MVPNKVILFGVLFLIFSCTYSIVGEDDTSNSQLSINSEQPFHNSSSNHSLSDTTWVKLASGIILAKIDSLLYWDDMVFSENGLSYLCPDTTRSAVRDVTDYYWPHSIVPYVYNANIPDTSAFRAAMNQIQNNSGVRFRPKALTDNNYIEFILHNSENSSNVGMQGGCQFVKILNYNNSYVIMHEILHSLGFFHEHCRADRDSYIIINWDNIKDEKEYNFQKYTDRNMSGLDLGFLDFNSIMIYSSYISDPSFVEDPTIPVMTKLNGDTFQQGTQLSYYDKEGIKSIYGPPYHRLEKHRLRIVEDEVSGFTETFITEHADSIIFYTDNTCSTRQALSFPRRIKVLRTVCTDYNLDYHYEYHYYTITIPAGTSAYSLWHGFNYECYYCSDPSNYRVTTHEIVNEQIDDISYFHE